MFPRNPVLLDLLVLALVLLECLLLVLCNEVVNVGSTLAGRDVPWRTGVEDPANIMLARVLLQLLQFQVYRFRVTSAPANAPNDLLLLLQLLSSSSRVG